MEVAASAYFFEKADCIWPMHVHSLPNLLTASLNLPPSHMLNERRCCVSVKGLLHSLTDFLTSNKSGWKRLAVVM